ncbi:MAG: nucleoside hydrolase [Chloroflexi bacterium]|nr:nucleoside hydrolase [Chloroflexota bacterium]
MTEPRTRLPAILDTDIGTDVDDILALVLLARASEMDLIGVTTVYGDTVLRARMVRHVLDLMGRSDVPIGIGARETLTGRPVWWAGHEGQGIPDLNRVQVDESITAIDLLRRAAMQHRGRLDLFAIGPLTNVAEAIAADDSFAASLHHLYIMGGAFWIERPEHNIKCDPEAADIVFRSGIPMTVCGLDVTKRVWLRESGVSQIGESAGSIGPMLQDQIRRWWAFIGANENTPHDPLAILPALRPELFRFEQCDVRVELDGSEVGRTRVDRCGEGRMRIAADVDVEAAEEEIIRRLAESD